MTQGNAAPMRRIVVVGNGIAGLTACDSLRGAGFDGELTIVGAESHHPYSRPALSKALLHGQQAEVPAHELPAPTHQATELLGISAVGLDPEARLVRLDDGTHLPYDGLVIASGARSRRLEGDSGADGSPVLTLRSIEDATTLKKRLAGKPSVIVVGGGPLGMEVASGCLQAGCEVTIVTDVPPLARQLGNHLSGIFVSAAVHQGLRLVTGGKARLLPMGRGATGRDDTGHNDDTGQGRDAGQDDGGARVALADGTELRADLVVAAIGDCPNVEWLAGSGLLEGPGPQGSLVVDSRGRVRPGIVAAGDVAWFPGRHGLRRVPLWTSAIDQARIAAVGLLHGDAAPELDAEPYFWTEGFGLSLKAVGRTPVEGAPDYCEPGDASGSVLMRWAGVGGYGTAVAVNYRIPVPKLRRLASDGPGALRPVRAAVHR